MKKNSFYITTPIYYANADLHIGHAFTTLAADTATRYQKALGNEAFFLTGSDEHGQKVEQAAKLRGISPKQHTDEMVEKFISLWKKLDIKYDKFVRTTDDYHAKTVQHVLTLLHEKGHIYEDKYQGWYCTPCERFWTEKEVPEKVCPDCKRPVETIEEKNYFFRMSTFQNQLIEYIKNNPNFIRPESRMNEVLGFLNQPLADLCISRPKKRLSWGIEIPFDRDYVTYVWFDALTNYISAAGYPHDMNHFNKYWPASFHLIGKDILTTHSVYWSTMLMALGLPLPECIFAHGWWVLSGGKMSKSVGNVVDPLTLVDKYGLDSFRFFLFREMVFGADAAFSEESFVYRYNADLANDFGNLLQRILPLVHRYRNGVFHKPQKIHFSQTEEVISIVNSLKSTYFSAMNGLQFHDALAKIWELITRLNKYVDELAPWSLAKAEKTDELDEVFYTIGEGIRIVAHLVNPFMPHKAPEFLRQIGLSETFQPLLSLEWGQLPDATLCRQPEPIFPRIDTPRIENLKTDKNQKAASAETSKVSAEKVEKASVSTAPAAPSSDSSAAEEALIEYEDFMKTHLCVAEVITAEKVEKADKLLKLSVRIGEETRSLVAGIALHYKPEDLIGKQVVMVKNLKPAKIRGVVSHGMILAAGTPDGGLALVTPSKPSVCGVRVK
ncbi:MAG: methionine--tRNA ligase [Candidatus Riflebacteria bacterium]|nr:methionine--tRNA ligase [Candidatus Riflebacteria bacterium]